LSIYKCTQNFYRIHIANVIELVVTPLTCREKWAWTPITTVRYLLVSHTSATASVVLWVVLRKFCL